jgi:DMSO/TMAO reductase YedYZ heme-binding membrane subunit
VLLLVACLVQMLVWSAVADWPEVPTELVLVAASFVHLCAWRQLTMGLSPWWPGASPTLACLAPPVGMVLVVSLGLVAITPASSRPPSPGAAALDHPSDEPT